MAKDHHKKRDIVYNRPDYRDARWEKATKVYTVNQESKYVIVQNVHALGVTNDLIELFSLYGDIEEYRTLDDYPCEEYCDVYWIKFSRIGCAKVAKKKLDNWSFFGKLLHVCYAPEYESVYETREKLAQRREIIAQKTRGLATSTRTSGTSRTACSSPVGSVLPSCAYSLPSDPREDSKRFSLEQGGSETGKVLLPHPQPSHTVLSQTVTASSSTHKCHKMGAPGFRWASKVQTPRANLRTADAGDMSVDKSIKRIQQHMHKVWGGSTASPLSSSVTHPKKRQRI